MEELIDLYDENRIPLGRIGERHRSRAPGEHRIVVHVCVFDRFGRMLIQRRSAEKATWPGRWDVSAGGGVDAGETSRQGAEREFLEELGFPLKLTGIRPTVTVNFPGGFDDFFIVFQNIALKDLILQREEVGAVRYATLEKILHMLKKGEFVPYPKNFLRYLFETREHFGFHTHREPN